MATPEYSVFRARLDRLVEGVKPVVGKVARKAFEKDLISAQSLQEAEKELTDQENRTSQLLQLILSKVKQKEVHFETFIAILESVPVLNELAEELNAELSQKRQDLEGSVSVNCDTDLLQQDSGTGTDLTSKITVSGSTRAQEETNATHGEQPCDVKNDSSSNSGVETSFQQLSTDSPLPSPSTGTPVEEEYSTPYFQCRCGSNCTLDVFLEGKCCGSLENSFPHLKVDHLSTSDQYRLSSKLIIETNEINKKFSDLAVNTFKALNRLQTDDIVELLVAHVFTTGQHILPRVITDEHSEKLSAIKSVPCVQIFLVRHKYISFFNYRILEKIIEEFLVGNSDLKQKLQDYLVDFREFCKRSVFEVPAVTIANSAPGANPKNLLVIKINETIWFDTRATHKQSQTTKFSLEDLITLQVELAAVIGVDSANLLLQDIKKGCVEASFVLLSNVAQSHFPFPLKTDQTEKLSQFGISVIVQPESTTSTTTGESSNNSEGQRSCGNKDSPEMKKDTPPVMTDLLQGMKVVDTSESALKKFLASLDKFVSQNQLEQAKLILRAYGLPHGSLVSVKTTSELYKVIDLQSEDIMGHDAICLLQCTLQMVGVDAEKVDQLDGKEKSLKTCQERLKFGGLVYQLCTGLSNSEFESLKNLAWSQWTPTLVHPGSISTREEFFHQCFSRNLLTEAGNGFSDMVRWLRILGRNDLSLQVDAFFQMKLPQTTGYRVSPRMQMSSDPYRYCYQNTANEPGLISRPEWKPEATPGEKYITSLSPVRITGCGVGLPFTSLEAKRLHKEREIAAKLAKASAREENLRSSFRKSRVYHSGAQSKPKQTLPCGKSIDMVTSPVRKDGEVLPLTSLGAKGSHYAESAAKLSTTTKASTREETWRCFLNNAYLSGAISKPLYNKGRIGGVTFTVIETGEELTFEDTERKRSNKEARESAAKLAADYITTKEIVHMKPDGGIQRMKPHRKPKRKTRPTAHLQPTHSLPPAQAPVSRLAEYCERKKIEITYSIVSFQTGDHECFQCIVQLRRAEKMIAEVTGEMRENKHDAKNSAAGKVLGTVDRLHIQ